MFIFFLLSLSIILPLCSHPLPFLALVLMFPCSPFDSVSLCGTRKLHFKIVFIPGDIEADNPRFFFVLTWEFNTLFNWLGESPENLLIIGVITDLKSGNIKKCININIHRDLQFLKTVRGLLSAVFLSYLFVLVQISTLWLLFGYPLT